jgi:hypothetical protein
MTDDEIHDQPSDVTAAEGVVSVEGPDGVDVRLTPEAADETSDRLLHGALQAKGQQLNEKRARRGKEPNGPGDDK